MADRNSNNVFSGNLLDELVEVLHGLRATLDPVEQLRPLSLDEAAKSMRCRRNHVERLIAKGELPCIRRDGRRYVLPSDVQQVLRAEAKRRPQPKRPGIKRPPANLEDVDPAMREFFE